MNGMLNFENCASVFNREIELVKKVFEAQDAVRQAVLKREWINFDEKIEEVKRLGGELALVENERELLFSFPASGSGAEIFNNLILKLPQGEQRMLSRLYRELKMETLKMKSLNESFTAYVNEAKRLASVYLEAVCPSGAGRLYTRNGSKVSRDLRSMVLNNRF